MRSLQQISAFSIAAERAQALRACLADTKQVGCSSDDMQMLLRRHKIAVALYVFSVEVVDIRLRVAQRL